ncbi:MAG TPA: sugar transferase [Fervidobacterium sp.]|jgi:lipopolysaccharide/colanic/teichoic acid biosynthesis glycosyltransferase|nr:sugar transferase [Fervidobacterium sp.]HUM44980.1 sugar transferase [Fervidobacterium sp.]
MADSTFAIESDQEHLLNIDTILQQKRLQLILKRIFDIVVSFVGLVILSPLFLILAIAIARDSKGPVFFKQTRVGRNEVPFKIYKFRTMVEDAEARGMQLTVGDDSRITKVGTFLRKTKIDELPQLINVFKGEMSFVGPRPEVPKYVGLYTEDQRQVLMVRPGITDLASIEYRNESELLATADNPEKVYIEEVMPRKIELNKEYIRNMSLVSDMRIILKTIAVLYKR